MQEACCRAEIERVAVFANNESVREVTETGLSVGHFCCQSIGSETRHLRIVAQKGASFTSSSKNEFTPLHLVAFNGDVDKAKIILEHINANDINQPGFGDVTPLHIAVMQVHSEHIQKPIANN